MRKNTKEYSQSAKRRYLKAINTMKVVLVSKQDLQTQLTVLAVAMYR
jgi:hypothetical protein